MVLEALHHIKNPTFVQPEPLSEFVANLFHAAGMPHDEAREAADILVDADMHGIETHGVAYNLDLHYLTGLMNGYINPTPNFQVTHETPSTAVFDADRGMGMVACKRAMELAIKKAKNVGVATVVVPNGSHFAAAGYYSRMALEHDMIGLTMSSGGGRVIIPLYGKQPWMGTNPIAFAAPADKEPPFVLDMATSTVAYGKLSIAEEFGLDVLSGWAQDTNGNPVTDMSRRSEVVGQPPLGETHEHGAHKGYGLGMMTDILSGVLSGETISGLMPKNPKGGRFCQYFQATRIDAFRPASEFKAEMDRMLVALRKQPVVDESKSISYAGLPEHVAYQERLKTGVPLPQHTVAYFKQMASELDVEYTL